MGAQNVECGIKTRCVGCMTNFGESHQELWGLGLERADGIEKPAIRKLQESNLYSERDGKEVVGFCHDALKKDLVKPEMVELVGHGRKSGSSDKGSSKAQGLAEQPCKKLEEKKPSVNTTVKDPGGLKKDKKEDTDYTVSNMWMKNGSCDPAQVCADESSLEECPDCKPSPSNCIEKTKGCHKTPQKNTMDACSNQKVAREDLASIPLSAEWEDVRGCKDFKPQMFDWVEGTRANERHKFGGIVEDSFGEQWLKKATTKTTKKNCGFMQVSHDQSQPSGYGDRKPHFRDTYMEAVSSLAENFSCNLNASCACSNDGETINAADWKAVETTAFVGTTVSKMADMPKDVRSDTRVDEEDGIIEVLQYVDGEARAECKKNHKSGDEHSEGDVNDVLLTSCKYSVLNLTCPLSGKPVVDLDDPVRSEDCHHIYDRGVATSYLASHKTEGSCQCAAAGCSARLMESKLVSDKRLWQDIDELRQLEAAVREKQLVKECVDIDDNDE